MSLGFYLCQSNFPPCLGVCPVVTCILQPSRIDIPCFPLSCASSSHHVSMSFPLPRHFCWHFLCDFLEYFYLNLNYSTFSSDTFEFWLVSGRYADGCQTSYWHLWAIVSFSLTFFKYLLNYRNRTSVTLNEKPVFPFQLCQQRLLGKQKTLTSSYYFFHWKLPKCIAIVLEKKNIKSRSSLVVSHCKVKIITQKSHSFML